MCVAGSLVISFPFQQLLIKPSSLLFQRNFSKKCEQEEEEKVD